MSRQHGWRILVGCGLMIAATSPIDGRQSGIDARPAVACAVTRPNGVIAGSAASDARSFGNEQLSTWGLWPGGVVRFNPGGAGFVTSDGALGMKFGWQRGARGVLTIEGRRLDGAASPLRSEVPRGYGDSGFQATYVIFPTPGCWEVVGRVGEASIMFVTMVDKIGDGPGWRRGF
jgi:hypothetical protein